MIKFHDAFEDENNVYVVMEYVYILLRVNLSYKYDQIPWMDCGLLSMPLQNFKVVLKFFFFKYLLLSDYVKMENTGQDFIKVLK